MLLYNTLTRQKMPFEPLDARRVTMYTCGPTVYRDAHIGNLRSYLLADWLKRVLRYLGYDVFHVKNITDVGHMRQELLDRGEDKVIAAARAAGKTSVEIARRYTEAFLCDEGELNILPADRLPKATEHIPQSIALIEKMIRKGHAYQSGGNVYFDVTTFPQYGKLSGNPLDALSAGIRGQIDPNKRHPQDFALWKAAEPGRELKWPSPWGEGFPGWHIECSAMSLHYLGDSFDIHTGGVDNIFPHHEDEIAQSESVTGGPVVRYWVHGQHLLADGLKMAKSTRNEYTLRDLKNRGFDPLAFRYLCLGVHYRNRLNFTFCALKGAQRGLSHLRRFVEAPEWRGAPPPRGEAALRWQERFHLAICDDLSLPRALGHVWEMLRDRALSSTDRARLLIDFDRVMGLKLEQWPEQARAVPRRHRASLVRREALRRKARFEEADGIRDRLAAGGFEVRDLPGGPLILRRSRAEWKGAPREISSSKEVPSLLSEPDRYEVTVSLVSHNNWKAFHRCYESIRTHGGDRAVQVVVAEGGSTDGTREKVDFLTGEDPDMVVWHADHPLGEGALRNIALRQALAPVIVVLDDSVELLGDVFTALIETLARNDVGATGAMGLVTEDFKEFEQSPGPEVHAVTIYCFALKRRILGKVGWMNERFRFYRNLDLDFSFQIRSHGYRIVVTPGLALKLHPHRLWEEMEEEERVRRSRANFYIFYRRWHHRPELVLPPRP